MQPEFEKYIGRFTPGLLSGNAYISDLLIKGKMAFCAWLFFPDAPTTGSGNTGFECFTGNSATKGKGIV